MTDEETVRAEHEELIERLRQGADEPTPEAWIPSEEDSLFVGTFVRLDSALSKFGPTFVATLQDLRTGELRSVWLYQTALRSQFARAHPAPGENVAIRYRGRKIGDNGQEYVDFKVFVDRPKDGGVPWSAVAATNPGDDDLEEPPVSVPGFDPQPDEDIPF
jgi:hypothetical protein